MATIAGLFDRYEKANDALQGLNNMGFGSGAVSVVAPEDIVKNNLAGDYTPISASELGNNQTGILITVIAESARIKPVQKLMEGMGATDIDTRYSVWERGGLDEYIEATEKDRDERASKE